MSDALSDRTVARRNRAKLADIMYGGFYRCPTTGTILPALQGDDKVLCRCGRSNPRVPQESTPQTGTHIVRYLQAATVNEFLDQEEARDAETT